MGLPSIVLRSQLPTAHRRADRITLARTICALVIVTTVAAEMHAAPAGVAPRLADELVGRIVPPYPDGLREWRGSCIAATPEIDDPCATALAVLGNDDAALEYIIATRLDHRDDNGNAFWRVTDVAAYPRVASGFSFETGTCAVGDRDDLGVMAVVRQTTAETWRDATWALRLNATSGRFEQLTPARVACSNIGAGE